MRNVRVHSRASRRPERLAEALEKGSGTLKASRDSQQQNFAIYDHPCHRVVTDCHNRKFRASTGTPLQHTQTSNLGGVLYVQSA